MSSVAGIPYWNDDVDADVRAAAEGDERAVTRLLTHLQPLVIRYCRARVRGPGCSFLTPEDIAQEISLGVLKALPGLREQNLPFLPFVYGIAAHKVADAMRAAKRDRTEPTAEPLDDRRAEEEPERLLLQAELAAKLDEVLAELPARQREIVLLRLVVGLSSDETARAVGSTPGAVRVSQHRALATLRTALRRTGEPRAAQRGAPPGTSASRTRASRSGKSGTR
ncbi:RNA polymerase sigma factor ShbA [Lentzea sp. NBRC 102530]|uniref:RNA polymerase sigma factor ShbA n=1 Tax=Lentzea sp. NBRC 102530 TaxID=3032201 RepID=UPI00255490DC|nr:RNA polymerase sigma factor ShbA [Lentzea sp. NBRC 102530]